MRAVLVMCCAAGLLGSAAVRADDGCDQPQSGWIEMPYGTGNVTRLDVPKGEPRPRHRVFAYEWHPDPQAISVTSRPLAVRSSTVDAAGNYYYYMRPPVTTYPQKETHISRSGRYTHSYATDIGLLQSSQDAGLRNTAARWLGKYGDPAALPYLQTAASQDPSDAVRASASESIVRIERRYAGRYALPD